MDKEIKKCIVITKDSLNNLNEVQLHDAEIKEITCNYLKHKIIIPLVLSLPEDGNGLLEFKGVAYS
jgi:hypothetical protein